MLVLHAHNLSLCGGKFSAWCRAVRFHHIEQAQNVQVDCRARDGRQRGRTPTSLFSTTVPVTGCTSVGRAGACTAYDRSAASIMHMQSMQLGIALQTVSCTPGFQSASWRVQAGGSPSPCAGLRRRCHIRAERARLWRFGGSIWARGRQPRCTPKTCWDARRNCTFFRWPTRLR